MNKQLPKDWKWVRLGEVCNYSKGKKPANLREVKSDVFSVPYINIKAFEKGIFAEYTDGLKCNMCNADDLLMVWDGARCGLIGKAKAGAVGSTLMKILPKANVHKEYLYNFISSKFQILNTKPKGVGIPHIEPNLLWNFEFVLPSMPTQQAIVSKIEELFSELDKGIENLKTAQQQIKIYRQSVLKWAFEGRLVNCLNHDSTDSSDLLDLNVAEENQKNHTNQTNHSSDKGELPTKWKCVTIDDIAAKITDGEHLTPTRTKTGEMLLSAKNIRDGYIDYTNHDFISKSDFDKCLLRCNPEVGDVLIVSVGATIGRASLVKEKTKFALVRSVALIKPQNIQSDFLLYFIQSPQTQKRIQELSQGSAQSCLYINKIKSIEIPLPPISEQQKIVQEIESRLSVADKLEDDIKQSLQQAEALRQSILKKAFEGKLTT